MSIVRQEFYCNDCPSPGGFIMVPLNMSLNRRVVVVCPKCGRKHPRKIKDGQIYDEGIGDKDAEEILPTMSAWSNTPRSKAMMAEYQKLFGSRFASYLYERNGKIIKSPDDLAETEQVQLSSFWKTFTHAWRSCHFMERWIEIADREKTG